MTEDSNLYLHRKIRELEERISELESKVRLNGLFRRGTIRVNNGKPPRWLDLGPYKDEPEDE